MSHISEVQFHEYLDGELTGDRAPELEDIEAHLKVCEQCAKQLEEERALVQEVSAMFSFEVPEHILAALPSPEEIKSLAKSRAEERVSTEESGQNEYKHARSTKTFSFADWFMPRPSLQLAASVVLCLGLGYAMGVSTGPSGMLMKSVETLVDTVFIREDFQEMDVMPEVLMQYAPVPLTEDLAIISKLKGMPVSDPSAADLAAPREIATGESVRGRLEAGDVVSNDGSWADVWYYRATAGRTVRIDLVSSDFDTYLYLGNEAILAEDDDSGNETNSRIDFTPTETATIAIVVNSFEAGSSGVYTLRVSPTSDEPPPYEEDQRDWDALYPMDGDPNDKYALVVGISDYPGSEYDLVGPNRDVLEFSTMLEQEFAFKRENIVQIEDDNATWDHIVRAFLRHLGQAGPDGVAVFFFSGHGIQVPERAPTIFDESDNKDEAIAVWGTENSLIFDDQLALLLDGLSANRILAVLDACFSGTGTRSRVIGEQQPKRMTFEDIEASLAYPESLPSGVLDSDPEPGGHILLAASAEDEVAYTDPEFGYGIFTRMLVEEMTRSDNQDSFDSLMDRVRRRTSTRNMYQNPQVEGVEGTRTSERVREFLRRRN